MRAANILPLLILVFSTASYAESKVSISTGFITGNTFRALDVVSKNLYATGIIDGMLLSPLYGAPKGNLAQLEKCTEGMNGQQLVAIFNKYLNSDPEVWDRGMHTIVYSAMNVACKT